MATVGSIVLGMSATTQTLKRDLDKGSAIVNSFADNIAGKAQASVTSAFAGIGSAISAVASARVIGQYVLSAAEAVDATGDMADQIGTTTNALASLRYAAKLTGSETSALDGALMKMNANLGDAATKGGPAADALTALGLDAKTLAQMDPSKAFVAIAGGFAKVPTAAEKAALAMDIFGKGGIGVLNTINAGSDAIAKLTEKYGTFGAASEDGRQRIGAMFDALDNFSTIAGAVAGRIASEVAPSIVVLTDHMEGLAVETLKAEGAFDTLLKGIGKSGPALGVGLARIGGLKDGIGDLVGSVLSGDTQQMIAALNKINAPGDQAVAGVLGDLIRQQVKLKDAGKEAGKGINDAFLDAANNAGKVVEKLKEQRDTFGMTASQVEIYKLKQDGVAASTIAQAEALGMEIKALEDKKKATEEAAKATEKAIADTKSLMESDAKGFAEAAMRPLEKFQLEQAKLSALLKAGLVTQQTVDRVTAKGKTELAGGQNPQTRAAALELGSNEARSAVLSFRDGKRSEEPTKEVAKNTAKTVDLQGQANALLGQVVGFFRNQATAAVEAVF